MTALSVMSTMSAGAGSFHRIKAQLFENSNASKIKSVLKLLAITLPGFVITVVLTAFNLSTVIQRTNDGNRLKEGLETALVYNRLQSNFAVERGLSCVALNSAPPPSRGFDMVVSRLENQMATVDSKFLDITRWYGDDEVNGPDFASRDTLHDSIRAHRSHINDSLMQLQSGTATKHPLKLCADNLAFYTARIDTLIALSLKRFKELDMGKFWLALEGHAAAMRRSNSFKLLRFMALESITTGNFSQTFMISFIEKAGANKYMERIAREQVPGYETQIRHLENRNVIIRSSLDELERELVSPTKNIIRDLRGRKEKAKLWSVKMRVLSDEYDKELVYAWDRVKATLNKAVRPSRQNFYIMLGLAILTTVLISAIVYWYLVSGNKSLEVIQEFLRSQNERSEKIKEEKQRTEDLVNQMLPKSVGRILRAGGVVHPENYDLVTIFFSDIHAFNSLTAISTALQMINLLNSLYSLWDGILSQYDCYKVETIADSYVVASGLPLRNGQQHSNEICSLALRFMEAMEDFVIPQLPHQKLLIRIGIHTGPIATGVVGSKMPRYCLFGDTMNTTARLQTSSKPLHIQISGFCKEHLEQSHPNVYFETRRRGVIAVKGKGEIETFWLLGKDGFPYRLSLRDAERRTEECIYSNE